jgi:predicted HTH transcriptional regulator
MDNFEEYIRQGEPNKAEKAKDWKTAIGLQKVVQENHLLKNREMHVHYVPPVNDTVNGIVKMQNGTVNDTVCDLIKQNNQITAAEIGERLNISLRTAKRKIKELKEKGTIERIGSDKTGYWKIIEYKI